jgi:hypothetical protein
MSVNEMVDRLRWQAPSISFCDEAADMLVELREENERLREVLQPFVARNSSEETIAITVRTIDIARARAALEPRK